MLPPSLASRRYRSSEKAVFPSTSWSWSAGLIVGEVSRGLSDLIVSAVAPGKLQPIIPATTRIARNVKIGLFIESSFLVRINPKFEYRNPKRARNTNIRDVLVIRVTVIRICFVFRISCFGFSLLSFNQYNARTSERIGGVA